jgi:queuine tRNA-ribosyltransferase
MPLAAAGCFPLSFLRVSLQWGSFFMGGCMRFTVEHSDANSEARAGMLSLPHGDVPTPVFMPVGTQGTVKAMTMRDIEDTDAPIILNNTYHLFLRPGLELLEKAGGLHRFIGWQRPILTDSGGFQVYSLADLRKLTDEAVTFKSHIDGSVFTFTPESVVKLQEGFGVDIMMQLDECPPATADKEHISRAVNRSLLWAERSRDAWSSPQSSLFGIVQGGLHADLRLQSAEGLIKLDLPGYALGGFSVGEVMTDAYPVIEKTALALPREKPRYLMGVGTPEDIVRAVGYGVDMFDCVLPTRCARNGLCFCSQGKLRIKNACYTDDFTPLDAACSCYACRNFTRSYIRHLYMAREITALILMTIHNITYYLDLCCRLRQAILQDGYRRFCEEFFSGLTAA